LRPEISQLGLLQKTRKSKTPTCHQGREKSKSSAVEMLRFLERYTEHKEKLDAEKLHLLRSMKEEKKEFLAQCLDAMIGKTSLKLTFFIKC